MAILAKRKYGNKIITVAWIGDIKLLRLVCVSRKRDKTALL